MSTEIPQTPESKETLREVSLVFLIKQVEGKVKEICLAMKKRGFGAGKWNGTGGKLEEDESVEIAAHRETKEEIDVDLRQMGKVAEIEFYFPHNPTLNQKGIVYLSEVWDGEPTETEEMKPQWFDVGEIPYEQMWSDDKLWLPQVLEGQLIKARFVFDENNEIVEQDVEQVDSL